MIEVASVTYNINIKTTMSLLTTSTNQLLRYSASCSSHRRFLRQSPNEHGDDNTIDNDAASVITSITHRSVLDEHLDDRITIGMTSLIYGTMRETEVRTRTHRVNHAKQSLAESSSPLGSSLTMAANPITIQTSSTDEEVEEDSLASLDWEDDLGRETVSAMDDNNDNKPASHIAFPTPLTERHRDDGPSTSLRDVCMDQVAALVCVLAVCCFFYLQHHYFDTTRTGSW